MATVATAFAAVTGSVGAINTVSGWITKLQKFIEKCGEAGERIQDIDRDVDSCKTELDQWQEKWKISPSTTSGWEVELWGLPKMKAIRLKTTEIQSMCMRFQEDFDGFFQPDLSAYLNSVIISGQSISTNRAIAAHRAATKANSSAWKIVRFVRNLDPLATKWLEKMQNLLSELSETSDKAFFDKHEEEVTRILTEAQLEKVRTSRLMQMAVDLRDTSQALYQSCLDAQLAVQAAVGVVKSTRLKVDLTGKMSGFELESVPSRRDILLIYHLFLQWDGEPHEICIEGPIDHEEMQPNAGNFGVFEAYEAIRIQEETTITVNDTLGPRFFLSRPPHDDERLFGPTEGVIPPVMEEVITLAQFLTSLVDLDQNSRRRTFPLLERFSLAFKIVESAILLAGTSWLSSMNSDSLRRFRVDESDHYNYTIDIRVPTEVPAEVPWKSFIRLSGHIFRVGVVLVEIGCGKRVTDIQYDFWGTLIFQFDNSEELLPVGPMLKDLESCINEEYASMVAYCLEKVPYQCNKSRTLIGNDLDKAYKTILKDYFAKVYLQMCEKANFLALMAKTVAISRG